MRLKKFSSRASVLLRDLILKLTLLAIFIKLGQKHSCLLYIVSINDTKMKSFVSDYCNIDSLTHVFFLRPYHSSKKQQLLLCSLAEVKGGSSSHLYIHHLKQGGADLGEEGVMELGGGKEMSLTLSTTDSKSTVTLNGQWLGTQIFDTYSTWLSQHFGSIRLANAFTHMHRKPITWKWAQISQQGHLEHSWMHTSLFIFLIENQSKGHMALHCSI